MKSEEVMADMAGRRREPQYDLIPDHLSLSLVILLSSPSSDIIIIYQTTPNNKLPSMMASKQEHWSLPLFGPKILTKAKTVSALLYTF